ncbi:hypothetical protein ACLOJK_021782 [Asimina triloba]
MKNERTDRADSNLVVVQGSDLDRRRKGRFWETIRQAGAALANAFWPLHAPSNGRNAAGGHMGCLFPGLCYNVEFIMRLVCEWKRHAIQYFENLGKTGLTGAGRWNRVGLDFADGRSRASIAGKESKGSPWPWLFPPKFAAIEMNWA